MRQSVSVPQEVVDEHALVAQRYAGYLVGHPIRAERYTTPLRGSVTVDRTRAWVEPNPMQDDCLFCQRLTDDEAVRRVAGFQAAIDKEVLGTKWRHLNAWAMERGLDPNSHAVRRQFIEENQNVPRDTVSGYGNNRKPRPTGWLTKAAPLVSMPLRIKRKLCIDWNHVYTAWMKAEGLEYDFEKHEFFRNLDVSQKFHDEWMGL